MISAQNRAIRAMIWRNLSYVLMAVIVVMALTGCATRYVRVPCLTPEQYQQRKDAEPKRVGPELTGDAQKDVRTIGGSAKELRAWGVGNLDILGGCVG